MVSQGLALGITVATLALFTWLGIRYARGRITSTDEYLTARNSTKAGMTTATLIASSMGAWILFSPAETAAAFGGLAALLGYAFGSALPLIVFAWMGPRVRELMPKGRSLTEFAQARFGAAMHGYVLLVSLSYMFIFLAAEMTGISGALELVAGIPAWQTAALVGLFVVTYTAYGGLHASIFTDAVQTLIILPLILIAALVALVSIGGFGEMTASIQAADATLLDPGFVPGLQTGLMLTVAILGAEMLNQAWWQRIYAAQDAGTLRRSFIWAAMAILPIILIVGFFGLAAQGLGLVQAPGDASISFFLVTDATFPAWLSLGVVLLAVLLVMSTADTLLNAISSLATGDLPHLVDVPTDKLTTWARVLTVVVAIGATFIGAQGYSVLTLFLFADLFAAATFIPLLAGLFSRRLGGGAALTSSVVGLLAGLVLFPYSNAWFAGLPGVGGLLPAPSMLYAFLAAAGLSGLLTWALSRMQPVGVDLTRLAKRDLGVEEEA
ncbi:MAG: sodium:proline symporter [Candidatus Thermoplasmatota archaeon]|nr:sodium:proline symporter [Candidatus Thermoplasmatota archaeon]